MVDDDLPPDEGLEGVDASLEADDQPEAHTEQHDEPQSISVDDLATEMGWTPKDKWRGDPDKWRPAADFLKRTVDVNRSLSTEVKTIKATVETMARTSAKLTERAVTEALEKAHAEKVEAIEMGDVAAVDRADRKIAELSVEVPQVAAEPVPVRDFKERNPWYGKDESATKWAFTRAGQLGSQGITDPAEQLEIVEREAKGLFPRLFPADAPKPKPAPLSKPGNRGSAPQAKGFASLPEPVKKAAIEYETRSKGSITREDYARTYYEEQGQ